MNREPLFRRLLGPAFDELHPVLRAMHTGETPRFAGHCEVIRGEGALSRVLAAIAGLPPAGGRTPIAVTISPFPGGELWQRDFGGYLFTSTLRGRSNGFDERVGPATFSWNLAAEPERIRWELVGMRVLGVPVPAFARAAIEASESLRDGSYRFDVRVSVPLAGLLVHYRGRLAPA